MYELPAALCLSDLLHARVAEGFHQAPSATMATRSGPGGLGRDDPAVDRRGRGSNQKVLLRLACEWAPGIVVEYSVV